MNKIMSLVFLVLIVSSLSAKDNLELESLRIEFDNFISEQKYKPYATAEKAQAKTAIEALYNQRGEVKNHAVYMARNYLKKAKMAAEAAYLESALKETEVHLQTVNMKTLKAEATLARMEADRAQLLIKLHAEEADRARQEKQSAIELANQKASEAEMSQAELQAAQAYAKAQEKVAALAKEEADLAFAEIEALRMQLESLVAKETEAGLMMTLGDFVFASGSANLKQAAVDNFDRVMQFISGYPERDIRIEGHTDSSGSEDLNQKLSQRRADAVKQLLIQNGIAANRIKSIGQGEAHPVASNNTEAGKAKNRRVDIILLK
jgi:outer membrane protein OmpA-like peptidoglycan-associated protein